MNAKIWVAVAITLLFWSSAFAGIRAGLEGGYTPGHLVLLRFLSASAVFLIYAIFRRIRIPKGRDLVRVIALAFCGISIYHIALTYGEVSVPAGTASLLIAAAPAITAVIATVVLHERLRFIGWVGIALGFAGIAVITVGSGESGGFTAGALLVLLSAVCTSFFFVFQKPLFVRFSAIDLTAWFTWIGTIPMLIFLPGLFGQMQHATAAATWSGIYIGVFPAAVAYVAWAYALAGGKASGVASTLYINPILATLFGWFWLGELPTVISLIGGAIALFGVILVNVFGGTRARVTRQSISTQTTPETQQSS